MHMLKVTFLGCVSPQVFLITQLFRLFGDARDKLHGAGHSFEFWLNVEAFEYLRDDPCLPVDSRGSGMAELLDRTTKSR